MPQTLLDKSFCVIKGDKVAHFKVSSFGILYHILGNMVFRKRSINFLSKKVLTYKKR